METIRLYKATILSLLLVFMGLGPITAQEEPFIPEDPLNEPFSQKWTYLENAGQVYDLGGNFREDVRHVSVGTNPSVYLMKENKIAVVLLKYGARAEPTTSAELKREIPVALEPDSLFRIDITLVGEAVTNPDPILLDEIGCKYNFYEKYTPHGITDVQGGKRVFYKGVYPNIDMHVLSVASGPKVLLVVRPGGDPSNIFLKLEGQDSLKLDMDNILKVWFKQKHIKLLQGMAYQQTGNSTNLVPWTALFQHQEGSDLVTFQLGTYDNTKPLILNIRPLLAPPGGPQTTGQPPEWCSYFDGTGDDAILDMDHDVQGNTYFIGYSNSSTGLPITFTSDQPTNFGVDAIVGRMNQHYEMLTPDTWMTYMGSDGNQFGGNISYDPVYGRVAITANSLFDPMPNFPLTTNPSCFQGGDFSSSIAWLGTSGIDDGHLIYRTKLHNYGVHKDLDHDGLGNLYVISDTPGFGSDWVYPVGGGFFDSYNESNIDFNSTSISKFTPDANLVWSTRFGGPEEEYAGGCFVDKNLNRLYICGQTTTPASTASTCGPTNGAGFPMCNSGGYFQNNLNGPWNGGGSYDGYIAAFDLTTLGLVWSTLIGGPGDEGATDIQVAQNGSIYVVGVTASPSYRSTPCTSVATESGFPWCDNGGYFQPGFGGIFDAYIAKFDPNTEMAWCTMVGGSKREWSQLGSLAPRLATEFSGNVFLYGNSASGLADGGDAPVTMLNNAEYYNEPIHKDHQNIAFGNHDTFVAGFDASDDLFYSSYIGGVGADYCGGIDVHSNRLYISGVTNSSIDFPTNCVSIADHTPYCDLASSATAQRTDGFMAQLKYEYTVGENEHDQNGYDGLLCYPNPNSGMLNVRFPSGQTTLNLSLINALGQVVMQQNVTHASSGISLKGLASGVYTVSAQGKGKAYLGRIILE